MQYIFLIFLISLVVILGGGYLFSQYQSLLEENQTLHAQVAQLSAQAATDRKALDDQTRQTGDARQKLDACKDQRTADAADLTACRVEKKAAEKDAQSAQTQLQATTAQVEQLDGDLQNSRAQAAAAGQMLDRCAAALYTSIDQRDQAAAKAAALQVENTRLTAQMDRMQPAEGATAGLAGLGGVLLTALAGLVLRRPHA